MKSGELGELWGGVYPLAGATRRTLELDLRERGLPPSTFHVWCSAVPAGYIARIVSGVSGAAFRSNAVAAGGGWYTVAGSWVRVEVEANPGAVAGEFSCFAALAGAAISVP